VEIGKGGRALGGGDLLWLGQAWTRLNEGFDLHTANVLVDAEGQTSSSMDQATLSPDCSDQPPGPELCFAVKPGTFDLLLPDGSHMVLDADGLRRVEVDGTVRWNRPVVEALDAIRGPWLLAKAGFNVFSIDIDTGGNRWRYTPPGSI
jgi:hypothetical protein